MSSRGLAVLEALLREFGSEAIAYVVTASDRGVRRDYQSELTTRAERAGLPVFDRKRLPDVLPAAAARFAAGWRWLLPAVAGQPIVVFHDSLLPRYRGFAPLVSSLVNGETTLGVTALLAAESYDAGPILAQEAVEVGYPLRIAEAIEATHSCYSRLAIGALRDLLAGTGRPRAQDESQATYSLWRDELDYLINWEQNAAAVRRHVDATGDPYFGASTCARGRKYRVLSVVERPDVRIENRTAGKIIFLEGGKPVVVCRKGLLRIEEMVEDGSGTAALPWPHLRTRFDSGSTTPA